MSDEHIPGEYDPALMDPLAKEVAVLYDKNPLLTINLISSQLDENVHDITYVLDAYEVVEGGPVHRGPGLGGNWLPSAHLVSMEPLPIEEVGVDTGEFRWPGGSMHSVQFDITNAEHRAIVGITDEDFNKLAAQGNQP